jgi:DNA topoisomerase-1
MSSSDDDVPLSLLKKEKKEKKEKKHKKHKKHKKDKKSKKSKKRSSSSSSSRRAPAKRRRVSSSGGPSRAMKAMNETQLLDGAMKAHKWWEDPPQKRQRDEDGELYVPHWTSLEHIGVVFPEEHEIMYDDDGERVTMHYDGQPVDLSRRADEVAHFYAKSLTAMQLQKPETAKIFNKNFFAGFKKVLKDETGPHKGLITDFAKCNFQPIKDWLDTLRDRKKEQTKTTKERLKNERAMVQRTYGYALVNGRVQKVGNTTIEPPGLFRGRGLHPKMGTIKERVPPEAITINVSRCGAVPLCPLKGRSWGAVVHDPKVTWLATWKENINGNTKYVYLSAGSGFKGKSDLDKYEKARKLKKYIGKIRADYRKKLTAKNIETAQIATAMWVVDILALRVGAEKGEDEADTVGCCSLRKEHFSFEPGPESPHPSDMCFTLDFLGKDSMRYFEVIDLSLPQYREADVGKKVYANLQKFYKRAKKPGDDMFDKLTPTLLNDHLKSIMPGLSAKVFRTYNASITLEEKLPLRIDPLTAGPEQLLTYNAANREVAILCNHQRSVPASFSGAFDRLKERLRIKERQLEELRAHYKRRRKGKDIRLQPQKMPEDKTERMKLSHLYARQPDPAKVADRIAAFEKSLKNLRSNVKNKEDNKSVSLSTSKINYMDPRVTVAWCKRNEVPIERVFPKALQDKFPWAMSVPETWRF